MDYITIYKKLTDKAKTRVLPTGQYVERHHIVPKCMGGTDDEHNIVNLTPEEHFLAHQLLIKIHPQERGLVWAAIMMSGHQNGHRNNNKTYGWIKRKLQVLAKQRVGDKNGSFNKKWFYNILTAETIKTDIQPDQSHGWYPGRLLNPSLIICKKCGGPKTKNLTICSDCKRDLTNTTNVDKLKVNNGEKSKFITKDEMQCYIKAGWNVGGLPRPKRCWINNKSNEERLVLVQEKKAYIKKGWSNGRITGSKT